MRAPADAPRWPSIDPADDGKYGYTTRGGEEVVWCVCPCCEGAGTLRDYRRAPDHRSGVPALREPDRVCPLCDGCGLERRTPEAARGQT